MPRLDDLLPDVLDTLVSKGVEAGSINVGIGDPFEGILRVVLERMLDANRVNAVIDALRDDGFLDPAIIAESNPSELVDAIRNAGLKVNDKAIGPLRRLGKWLAELHQGAVESLVGDDSDVSTSRLREELLELSGIGPATADAILLHALDRPVFPVDRAAYRIMVRHGWLDATADYEEARDTIERLGRHDPALLRPLAHAFEAIGAGTCRASVAKCERCVLKPFLPESGPIDPNG